MPTIDVVNTAKETVGSVELPDDIFGVEVKEHLFYTVVRYQLANRRAGTHKVKSRCEVSGGGRKPFKQKGTGRARQGTIRAPRCGAAVSSTGRPLATTASRSQEGPPRGPLLRPLPARAGVQVHRVQRL